MGQRHYINNRTLNTSTAGKGSKLFSEVTITVSNYTGLHEFAVLEESSGLSWFLTFSC